MTRGFGVGRDPRTAVHPDEYYRVLVEQATDGIFIANEAGTYIEVNPSGHRLLGYAPGELIGKHLLDILHTSEHARLAEVHASVLRGEVQTEEWTIARKDGSVFDAEISAQRLSDGRLFAILRDVSRRKHVERQTRASEAQLRSVLETAPDIIMTVNRAGTILFINRAAPPVTIEQVLGTPCFDYVEPESHARVARAIEHVFTTRTLDEYEVLGPHDTRGERVAFLVRVGPVIENDEVVAATFCATNVTPHRRAEAKQRELFDRLRKIAGQVPGVVFQFSRRADGGLCLPYASDQIRDVFRVSPAEVREDAAPILAVLHPDDRDAAVASMIHSAETLEPWRSEFRVRFPNGDVRWLFGNSNPERLADGAVQWHGFITDITQEKAAAATQAYLEEQLRQAQKMESIGRLAGGVAHDFNNLLTSVMGFTELALGELPKDAKVRRPLENVIESAQRGATLTQQLLAFARKKLVHPTDVDITEVVRRMLPMIERLVGEHLELTVRLWDDPCVVRADIGSLEQVIMNLVVNARDAMPHGGQLRLSTECVKLDGAERRHPELAPGAYVVLTVSDTGTGMSDEVRARLFEPFFTTKPLGEGTGLGLAMCHGMVKQAGGSVSVRTALGQGTDFRIFLPRVAGSGVPITRPGQSEPRRVEGRETLLVVEDEPRILAVAHSALTRFGYRVLHASNGHEALALVASSSERIQLLVTDVIMPKMSGQELAARLMDMRPGLKVLYCSGYTNDAILGHAGLAFLQKPYTPTALAQRIRDVLDTARSSSDGSP
ncbi:MAG TPA: PAS domain S-box protein [Polyangiales bacterium]